jgi:hypothetical protein
MRAVLFASATATTSGRGPPPTTQPDHPWIGFGRLRSQQIGACPVDEQPAQITVAPLGDATQPGFPPVEFCRGTKPGGRGRSKKFKTVVPMAVGRSNFAKCDKIESGFSRFFKWLNN